MNGDPTDGDAGQQKQSQGAQNQQQLTNLFEAQETLEQLASTVLVPAAMVGTAATITYSGGAGVAAACADGPAALLTCLPAVAVVVPTVVATDLILLEGAYTFTVNVTIPTWERIF